MSATNKALFLDRDGIINIDKGYVSQKEDFEFQKGIFELLNHAKSLGYNPHAMHHSSETTQHDHKRMHERH
ncbi:hypothetical protein HpHA18_07790 [Helicobacter pylori]